MRKTSRLISLLLTVAMMVTMVLPMTVSAAFTDVPSDHHYYKAITNLSAEGVLNGFEDGSFKPGDPVTRAQFTKIICYALSVGDLTYSEAERSIFTDLAPDHWAANNIVTAYNQKIINGMGDGTFAPEAGVQYEQAVKMAVCALGYGPRALTLGEYPAGYMNMANQLKLLKGITDAKMYEVMNRGAVAQLIDNMMNANQLQDGQQGGSIREEVSTNKNVDCKVLAGEGVALYAGDAELDACRKNEIIVAAGGEYVAFDISELKNFDIYEYLGRSVTIYYEEETGVGAQYIKSIALQNRKNETIKIDLDKIFDYDDSSIEYYIDDDRNETETVTYQTTSNNIWNGQPDSRTVKQLLDYNNNYLKAGYITLVSSQANQSADVAFLKTYDTIVVDNVVTKDYKVFGKNGYETGIVLDVTDRTKKVTIKQDGKDFALSSIRENHILSISKDPAEKVIEVLVSTKSASGTIESASGLITTVTPNVPKEFKLNNGNTTYTVSPDVFQASSSSVLEVGKYVTISLDAFGKVARYVVTGETSYTFGYIASLEDDMGTSAKPEIWVMLYKPEASNKTLTGNQRQFAEKVNINGTNYRVEDDFHSILTMLETSANTFNANTNATTNDSTKYAQPVRYSLNNSNQINAIITGTVSASSDNTTKLNILNNVTGVDCTVDGSTFGQYRVQSSTPIIVIPEVRSEFTKYASKTNKLFEAGTTYYAQFANLSTAGVIGCVYVYGVEGGASLNASITDENKPLIVKEKGTVLYKDVNTTKLTLIDVTAAEGAEPIVCYEDARDLDFLEVGDVVRVAIGADEYVEEIEVLADLGTVASDKIADADPVVAPTFSYSGNYWFLGANKTTDDLTADFRVLLGTAKAKETGTLVVSPGYDGSVQGESIVADSSVPVFKIDIDAAENMRIDSGSISEIITYNANAASASRVLVYMVEGTAKAIIIFE